MSDKLQFVEPAVENLFKKAFRHCSRKSALEAVDKLKFVGQGDCDVVDVGSRAPGDLSVVRKTQNRRVAPFHSTLARS
jgi:hypothetical protein